MSTLILTSNTGEGHNSCAKAIKEAYDAHDESCCIVDALDFVSDRFSDFTHDVHTALYRKHPKLFKAGYSFTEKHSRITTAKGSIPYKILESGVEGLYKYIKEHGTRSVICVHPLLMMMLSALRENYPCELATAFVATDYTCSPGVKDSVPEICFIPDSSLADEFRCENIPTERIFASGIPVRRQFYSSTEKERAKAYFNIPDNIPHLVIMSGSMGCGPMQELLAMLCGADNCHITVVCGNNGELYAKLVQEYSGCGNVHILAYVEDVPLLLDSADLFVSKPGGLSSTEAAVKAVPMVLLNTVGGCESHNLHHFVSMGGAVAAESAEEAAELCLKLMSDGEARSRMRKAMAQLKAVNAAEVIYRTMSGRGTK